MGSLLIFNNFNNVFNKKICQLQYCPAMSEPARIRSWQILHFFHPKMLKKSKNSVGMRSIVLLSTHKAHVIYFGCPEVIQPVSTTPNLEISMKINWKSSLNSYEYHAKTRIFKGWQIFLSEKSKWGTKSNF